MPRCELFNRRKAVHRVSVCQADRRLNRRRAARCVVAITVAATAVFSLSMPAQAQFKRNFPATALRGTISFTEPPEILLNGKSARLSPGSRIRSQANMQVLSASLVGQKLTVNYTLEVNGLVHDVWLLRDDEIAMKPWPRTIEEAQSWSFDLIGQTWTRP